MEFYCVKCKKKWNTNTYTKKNVNGKHFASTVHTCGTRNFRIVSS